METNGKISVIQTHQSSPITCQDLSLDVSEDTVMYPVIHDGRRCRWTYPLSGICDADIDKILRARHIRQEEVLVMTVDRKKEAYIVRKEETH